MPGRKARGAEDRDARTDEVQRAKTAQEIANRAEQDQQLAPTRVRPLEQNLIGDRWLHHRGRRGTLDLFGRTWEGGLGGSGRGGRHSTKGSSWACSACCGWGVWGWVGGARGGGWVWWVCGSGTSVRSGRSGLDRPALPAFTT